MLNKSQVYFVTVQKKPGLQYALNAYKGNPTFPEGPAPSSLEPPGIKKVPNIHILPEELIVVFTL